MRKQRAISSFAGDKMIRSRVFIFGSVGIFAASCSTAEFRGNSGQTTSGASRGSSAQGEQKEKQDSQATIQKTSGDKPIGGVVRDPKQVELLRPQPTAFGLSCEPERTIVFAPKEVPKAQFEAKVTGEFCKRTSNDLYILFIVDNSGSMGRHSGSNWLVDNPGNDPQVTIDNKPTCGRLGGAKAVIKKFQEPQFAGIKTRIGVISFASDVIAAREIKAPSEPLDDKIVGIEPFCETVIQGSAYAQPGGVLIPGIDSSTNYQTALLKAREILEQVEGQKLIYFITDGEPTAPDSAEVAANLAFEAANTLRATVKDLTFNALFLRAPDPYAAKKLLGKMTADPTRVLLADSPDDIARKIVEFPTFGFVGDSAKAIIEVGSLAPTTLSVDLMKHPTKEGVWLYKVAPFALLGQPGETIDHMVKVSAQGLDGSLYSSSIKVRYQVPR
jgi:hypothetical protein